MEKFYTDLYMNGKPHNETKSYKLRIGRNVTYNNWGSAIAAMRHNWSPGEDGIIEAIKAGGEPLLHSIQRLFDKCLEVWLILEYCNT